MKSTLFILLFCFPALIWAQQRPDTTFVADIEKPFYEKDKGPFICFDSAHNNFHTLEGGFAPTAYVLKKDGYRTRDIAQPVEEKDVLDHCEVYVTVNPIHESNLGNWVLPNPPVYSEDEVDNIKKWVEQGGGLFLIADHMPFPGAASNLSAAFGFDFSNGFAQLNKEGNGPDVFNLENKRLKPSVVTKGITAVTSFTGSAFKYPDSATPVMLFKEGDRSLEPQVAWHFTDSTKVIDLDGYAQGAIMEHVEGRVAVLGEAAMFTAQIVSNGQGEFKFGMNNKEAAPQNVQFLLNIIHWLDNGR